MTTAETRKFGLKPSAIDAVNGVFLKFSQVERAVIFGSRAKGNFKNGSDIDMALIGENLDLRFLSKLDDEIDELFLPYTFDFLVLEELRHADLREHIERVGQVFYQKDPFAKAA